MWMEICAKGHIRCTPEITIWLHQNTPRKFAQFRKQLQQHMLCDVTKDINNLVNMSHGTNSNMTIGFQFLCVTSGKISLTVPKLTNWKTALWILIDCYYMHNQVYHETYCFILLPYVTMQTKTKFYNQFQWTIVIRPFQF